MTPTTSGGASLPPPSSATRRTALNEKPWDNVVNNWGWFLFLALITGVVYAGVYYGLAPWLSQEYPVYSELFSSIALSSIVAHFIATVRRKIPEDERGAGFLLGIGLMELESGQAPIPYGIAYLHTVTQKPIRIKVGTISTDREGKPAEIVHDAAGNAILRNAEPRRIKFADGHAAPGAFELGTDPFPKHPLPVITDKIRERLLKDPANTVGTTTEPTVIIEMIIVRVIPFKKRVGNLAMLVVKVAEATMSVFQEAAGRIPVGFALENQMIIQARMRYALEELVGELEFIIRPGEEDKPTIDWGVDFRKAEILDIGYTHEVNKGIAEATRLAQEGRGLDQKSVGEAAAIERRGLAEARVDEAKVRARGKGLDEVANVIGRGEEGKLAAALQAQVDMMKAGNSNLIITGGGGSPLTEAAAVLGNMVGGGLGGQRPPKQPASPSAPTQPPQGGSGKKQKKGGQGGNQPAGNPPAGNPPNQNP